MLDLTSSLNSAFLPFIVLLSSLLGSWHCVGMCGPLVTSTGLQKRTGLYHLGRMISYTSLGALAGFFGQSVLNYSSRSLQLTSGLFMALILISLGFSFSIGWHLPQFFWTKRFTNLISSMMRNHRHHAFVLGLLTGFLPCGWLYSFVVLAGATQSLWLGASMMFIFWVGTVPALSVLSSSINKMLKYSPKKIRVTIGILFVIAGLYSLGVHLFFQH